MIEDNLLDYPYLSIVIPALNEEKTIAKVIDRIRNSMPNSLNYEVIVVNDGSSDSTAKIAEEVGAFVINKESPSGYGAALKTGFLQARGNFLAFLDADNTYPPEEIPQLLRYAKPNSFVIGSRFSLSRNGMTFSRKIGNILFAISGTMLTRQTITDLWSGLRLFDKNLVPLMNDLPDDLTFTPIMTLKILLMGFAYKEIRINYGSREGRSKLNEIHDAIRCSKLLITRTLALGGIRIRNSKNPETTFLVE